MRTDKQTRTWGEAVPLALGHVVTFVGQKSDKLFFFINGEGAYIFIIFSVSRAGILCFEVGRGR